MSSVVPEFAVVGRVNMGKSSVIATLLEIDDNREIRISPTPGETTQCQVHRVVFGAKECVRFIDTPGFSRPIDAMREIQKLHGEGTPGRETLRRFVKDKGDEFLDEKLLLQPLLDGAGVLYVVDPSKPLRDDFLAEIEILRWTGRPRLALMNVRTGEEPAADDIWREKLGSAFNLVRTFDAHRARYEQRLMLMKSLLEIEEQHRAQLEETIERLEMEWDDRRSDAAYEIREFLVGALELRASARIEERDERLPDGRARKQEELKRKYFEKLVKLEKRCFGKLLKIYRHHLLKVESGEESFKDIDLESEEVWMKWGLTRKQLVTIGAVTGAAGGAALDVATGGMSGGAFTVIGGLGGAGLVLFQGKWLPDVKLDLKGISITTGQTTELVVGPPRNPNFPWVLLDGVLIRYGYILERAHGRRDQAVLKAPDEEGYTKNFDSRRRKILAKWFVECAKGKRPGGKEIEKEVLASLEKALSEVEDSLQGS